MLQRYEKIPTYARKREIFSSPFLFPRLAPLSRRLRRPFAAGCVERCLFFDCSSIVFRFQNEEESKNNRRTIEEEARAHRGRTQGAHRAWRGLFGGDDEGLRRVVDEGVVVEGG
ncbi:MAG: hypothetical protein J6W95_03370, partial [Bacteroidales bacterium]|nr:hypothetical protein [Bacteroidales bacterium]